LNATGSTLGSDANDICNVLRFVNGIYAACVRVDGGAGIQSGYSVNYTPIVNQIVFDNGSYTASGHMGAGIGSGSGNSGNSTVNQILFNN
jgi:hypothetical protein